MNDFDPSDDDQRLKYLALKDVQYVLMNVYPSVELMTNILPELLQDLQSNKFLSKIIINMEGEIQEGEFEKLIGFDNFMQVICINSQNSKQSVVPGEKMHLKGPEDERILLGLFSIFSQNINTCIHIKVLNLANEQLVKDLVEEIQNENEQEISYIKENWLQIIGKGRTTTETLIQLYNSTTRLHSNISIILYPLCHMYVSYLSMKSVMEIVMLAWEPCRWTRINIVKIVINVENINPHEQPRIIFTMRMP